jgi:uncharacterized membrane protein YgcG
MLRDLSYRQQRAIERAIDDAEHTTGLQICLYLGPTGEDSRAHAEQLFVDAGLHSRPAVLIMVALQARRVEIITAPDVRERVPDDSARAAVDRMTERFSAGDLPGGVHAAIEEIVSAAGPGEESGEELPDFLRG